MSAAGPTGAAAATGDASRDRPDPTSYAVRWAWERGELQPGLTAVLRVRDEARNLPWVLPALLEAVPRVVLVDNLSEDDTGGVARRVAEGVGAGERLEVVEYPFEVSRCGPEHRATPADSVHSLTHFYNWSFAQARTRYSLKWDGDMVLTREGVAALRDAAWMLESREAMVAFQHFALYVASPQVAWFDTARNVEAWIHPQGPEHRFVKGFDWEMRTQPGHLRRLVLPQGTCFELKWLDDDEFAHWDETAALDPDRLPRKAREHAVFAALRHGRGDQVDGLHRVEAPPGTHVVDHVADTWLPALPRPFGIRG